MLATHLDVIRSWSLRCPIRFLAPDLAVQAYGHPLMSTFVTNHHWVCLNCDWDRLISRLASVASY